MHKKSGLIVGFLVIIIAVIIFLIASKGDDPEVEQTTELNTGSVVTETVETTQQQTPVVSNPSTNSVIEIDEDTLPLAVETTTIGYIQSKKILLVDGELYYSLGLLVGDDNMQLRYFVSKSSYDAVDVNDKCTVGIACYTTESGDDYYMVTGVSLV